MKAVNVQQDTCSAKNKELFLKLVHPVPPNEHITLTENDLLYIKKKATQWNLLPLIYVQLMKCRPYLSPDQAISPFLDDLKMAYLKNLQHSVRQETLSGEIVAYLRERGIPSVVIRGAEIARELYDDPYCRHSTDIDILVREADVLTADALLQKNGYMRTDHLNLKFLFYRLHHVVYAHPDTQDIIEMHWNFCVPSFFSIASEDIWKEVIQDKDARPALTPEMLIIMLLLHHHMHFFREFRILTDIVWGFAQYEKRIDWKMLVNKLEKIGLIKTAHIALLQMKYLWNDALHEMKAVQILSQEMNKVKKVSFTMASYFALDLDQEYRFGSMKDKLISRFALDHISKISHSFIKLLLPLPKVINELYEDHRKWMLPFNYLKFIKWRVKDWIG